MSLFTRITLPLAAINFINQANRSLVAVIGPFLALEFGPITATRDRLAWLMKLIAASGRVMRVKSDMGGAWHGRCPSP
ncbi:MAG: hypothetical protein ACKPB8_02400, partial [Alphaproteobacteria bacterium]